MFAFWSWVAGVIAGCRCKALLSECCLRFGAWLLQGATARCCCQSACAAAGAACAACAACAGAVLLLLLLLLLLLAPTGTASQR